MLVLHEYLDPPKVFVSAERLFEQFIDNKGNTLFAQDRTGLKIVIKKNNACTDWHLISLRMHAQIDMASTATE